MYEILKHGGFTTGGFNFDAKIRRQSIDHMIYFTLISVQLMYWHYP